jgi:hypothetical protein
MKRNILILLLVTVCTSCSSQNNKNEFVVKGSEAVLFFTPTEKQMDALQRTFKNEDDFNTAADDAAEYWGKIDEYLKENPVKYDTIPMNTVIYLDKEKERLSIPDEMGFGCLFIYKEGKYKEFVDIWDFIGSEWQAVNGRLEKAKQ